MIFQRHYVVNMEEMPEGEFTRVVTAGAFSNASSVFWVLNVKLSGLCAQGPLYPQSLMQGHHSPGA